MTAVVGAGTGANANSMAKGITDALSKGESIGGYQVMSGSATAKTNTNS